MSQNIRDFRNAGVQSSDEAESSNKGFYALVLAIPVIAVAAGLGYKPLMELRGQNVAAVQQAEADMEAKRRAENPLYALMNQPKNENGLIDPNAPINFGSRSTVSPEVAAARKAVKDYAKRPLTAKEFLGLVDAKAAGFSPLQLETLKYTRSTWALSTCGHRDMRAFYQRQNEANYTKLDNIRKEQRDAAREARTASYQGLEINKIETKAQAMAFVASGGVNRHMESVGAMFSGIDSELSGMGSASIRVRRQRFSKTGCMQVRTIVQSGVMRVKPNVRLK